MNKPELISFLDFLSEFSIFSLATAFFGLLIVLLCAYILIFIYSENRRKTNFERWKFISDTLIRSAIFFEENEVSKSEIRGRKIIDFTLLPMPGRFTKLLPHPSFRKLLTTELLFAKQNMSGTAASNLKSLFIQLKLDQDALKMIDSNSWYLKALGIQQIGIMELDEHYDRIFKYTNNKKGLIRVEAQNAIVKFSGFEGLRFLDNATYPISEWQQIKLLEELSQLPAENFTGIEKWLISGNDSVVIFALKLTGNYYRFELYDRVAGCLKHTNPEVRRQAINVLKELANEGTASHLIEVYRTETGRNKLTILKALEKVSTNIEIPFLLDLLGDESNDIKIAASRTLSTLGNEGFRALLFYPGANEYPYNEIINQIRAEKV